MDNIYIDRFLLWAFVKYILSQIYSHCIQNCTFRYFLEIVESFVSWGKYFQSLVIFMFLYYPETVTSITQKKLVVESCPTTQWTYIVFNFLSIGLQYTLLFKRRDFGLKCLVTITPKVQSLKFKANVWMKQANCRSLFELIEGNSVIIMEQKRKIECSWVCTFWTTYGFGRCRTLSLA